MKICFAIHSLQPGGMERVMSEIINNFSKREELELHLLMFGINPSIFYDLPSNLIIHKPSFIFNQKYRAFSTLKTIFFIRQKLKKIKPDKVLSFGNYWNNLVLLSSLGLKYPIYVSDRSKPDKDMGKLQNWLRKKLYPKAAGVIAQTEKAKKIYTTLYHQDNMAIIGNPIREIYSKPDIKREKIVLSVGRLINTKHYDRLIRLFSKIDKPEWKLVIVGGDALNLNNSDKLSNLVKELNLTDRVILTGTRKDVDNYYLKSSIFVFPSSSEGFPNVIGEAMQAELPVISYDCMAGPSDMIENGKNGWLVPVFDDEKMKEHLVYLMEHDEDRAIMGKYAKKSIQKFDCDEICSDFYNFITK